jgi:integrase
MTYKPKNSRYYFAKFVWKGQLIRKSTRATDKKTARTIEGTMRAELAHGNRGILEKKPAPTLMEFLKEDFEPFIKTEHKSKPHTLDYYQQGVAKLKASDLADLRLGQITSQHINAYIAQHGHFEESTINRDLRTLRRALNLAVNWGKLDRAPKVALAKGENRRERVLTDFEAERDLATCPQPWKDIATVMLGSGACPGELYELRWENVLLNRSGGIFQILKGKTRARRRLLPMVPAVHQALKARHEAQGRPFEGWVFPTGSASDHMEESSAKIWHAKALAVLARAHKENPEQNPEVKPFEPYCLRHTALTNLAAAGCDAFTLARIAGHSRITTTERYIHPQAEAIEQAFARIAASRKVVTEGGHS